MMVENSAELSKVANHRVKACQGCAANQAGSVWAY
jgi:hypothetical protein